VNDITDQWHDRDDRRQVSTCVYAEGGHFEHH